jgi:hypothetical protein
MRRAIALLLVAPFLTFASALAPQHVHEGGHDHAHVIAHSHFDPHHLDVHNADDLEIEHDIEHIVWLDSPILHQTQYRTASLPLAIPVSYEAVPVAPGWSVTPFEHAARVHGPPRNTPLFRGPPPSLV